MVLLKASEVQLGSHVSEQHLFAGLEFVYLLSYTKTRMLQVACLPAYHHENDWRELALQLLACILLERSMRPALAVKPCSQVRCAFLDSLLGYCFGLKLAVGLRELGFTQSNVSRHYDLDASHVAVFLI